ncbi:MAG: response regulator [Pseudanabaena sp. ELA607]
MKKLMRLLLSVLACFVVIFATKFIMPPAAVALSFNEFVDKPILVVDDYVTMRSIVRKLLLQLGTSNMIEAHDGESALRALRKENVALIIVDWTMQPMTGLQLLKEIRADADINLRNVPFLMMTAETRTDQVKASKEAGANDCIIKPFNAQTLKRKIESM